MKCIFTSILLFRSPILQILWPEEHPGYGNNFCVGVLQQGPLNNPSHNQSLSVATVEEYTNWYHAKLLSWKGRLKWRAIASYLPVWAMLDDYLVYAAPKTFVSSNASSASPGSDDLRDHTTTWSLHLHLMDTRKLTLNGTNPTHLTKQSFWHWSAQPLAQKLQILRCSI